MGTYSNSYTGGVYIFKTEPNWIFEPGVLNVFYEIVGTGSLKVCRVTKNQDMVIYGGIM